MKYLLVQEVFKIFYLININMYLHKEQILKGIFLQIANKYNLPKEIIITIYNSYKDDSDIRKFYSNLIYNSVLNVDTNYINFTDYIHLKNNTVWAIKWKRGEILREIHLKIKIFYEPNYLLQDYSYLTDGILQISIKRATTKKKLKYLNESPIDEIYDDYISYLNDNKEIMRSLVIDNYGEGNYFPHLMGH